VIIALKAILSRLKKGTKGRMRRAHGEAGIIRDCELLKAEGPSEMVARGTPVEYFKIQRGKHFTPVEQNKRLNGAGGVNIGPQGNKCQRHISRGKHRA
jgi:hypothetical protein